MKNLILCLSVLICGSIFAGEILNKKEIAAKSTLSNISIISAKRVFSDELAQEDLYWVSYTNNTSCWPMDKISECETFCRYVWVDTSYSSKENYTIEFTKFTCDQDIELLTNPSLIDEL